MTSAIFTQPRSHDRRAWILFAPIAVWLAAFIVAPTFILIVYSLIRRGDGPGEVQWSFTLANYLRCFQGIYLKTFGFSALYAIATTLLCALIGYPVAYFIGRASALARPRLLMLLMIPFWTSFLIRAYAWMGILSHDGLLNGLLRGIGLIPHLFPHEIELLYTPWAVLIALVYYYLPFMILPIIGSVEALDASLLEAASDLGAGPVRTFLGVILPLTLSGVAAGCVMVFVPAVAMFAITTLMSGGKLRLIGDEIQTQCIDAGNLPFGAAMGMVLLAAFGLSLLGLAVRRRLN